MGKWNNKITFRSKTSKKNGLWNSVTREAFSLLSYNRAITNR